MVAIPVGHAAFLFLFLSLLLRTRYCFGDVVTMLPPLQYTSPHACARRSLWSERWWCNIDVSCQSRLSSKATRQCSNVIKKKTPPPPPSSQSVWSVRKIRRKLGAGFRKKRSIKKEHQPGDFKSSVRAEAWRWENFKWKRRRKRYSGVQERCCWSRSETTTATTTTATFVRHIQSGFSSPIPNLWDPWNRLGFFVSCFWWCLFR